VATATASRPVTHRLFAVGRGHSAECGRAALLDVGVLHTRADLFKLGHVWRNLSARTAGQNRRDGGS
jgi:hypothetical protein